MQSSWSDRIHCVALVAGFVLAVGFGTAAAASQQVTICHFPPGNPDNAQVIDVAAPAVPAHVRLHNDARCPDGASDCCFGEDGLSVCTDLTADPDNCGECGVICLDDEVCTDGTCTPVP